MEEDEKTPLLNNREEQGEAQEQPLPVRVWEVSKKLWRIVGPAIFLRITSYSMIQVTQSFAGHLGDLELASMTIGNNVVAGFSFGMASALETLCGQAFGAKKYNMLGVYLQRSWIVLLLCATFILPIFFYATQLLLLGGEPAELAHTAGKVCLWFIPLHHAFALTFPLNRFLKCQMKNSVTAVTSGIALVVHVILSWLIVSKLQIGLVGAVLTLDFSWWLQLLLQFAYGGCPLTWRGFSMEAFSDLWDFIVSCSENWYYRVLIVLTGNLKNAEIAVDALSICMSINWWEMMIHLAFFAGTGVRVTNELGAGNGKAARFSTIISIVNSMLIGTFFWCLIILLHEEITSIFTSSAVVIEAVNHLYILLAFTIFLNSIQPILSGVAVGAGWQATVAYVNVGTYYLIGVPFGVLLGWAFQLGVLGIWAGMIGGTAVQTLLLIYLTSQCDWNKEAMKASERVKRWAGPK